MPTSSAPLTRLRYFTERESYLSWLGDPKLRAARRRAEQTVIEQLDAKQSVSQYCYAHGGIASLLDDPSARHPHFYNWREAGACGQCHAISRIRLVAEYFHRAANNCIDPTIYLTEQLTLLYKLMRGQFPNLVGSEYVLAEPERTLASLRLKLYMGDPTVALRHEDGCALTFADESLDMIGSFDVLEHIPDYKMAIAEFARTLRSGGQLVFSAPFLPASANTLIRARLTTNEASPIEHLEPAEFHGNPTDPDGGVLCYYHFGWDLLEQMRGAGFCAVALVDAWSAETAIYGDQQFIVATK